jgi:D-sedoheptulose 7-phosphate isomerase
MSELFFKEIFEESINCKRQFADTELQSLCRAAEAITAHLKLGHKLLIFGNGGSAADAQHLAAEFVNRLCKPRTAIPAIALTTDTSVLTSIANDYSFDAIFSRQIEAIGQKDDVAFGISTSGNSPNILKGFEIARAKGLLTIGLLGSSGGKAIEMVDIPIVVHNESSQRIQESHITIAHALCEWVEKRLFA